MSCGSRSSCYLQVVNNLQSVENSSIYSASAFPYAGTDGVLDVTVLIYIFKLLSFTNDKSVSLAMEIDLSWLDPNIPGEWSTLYTDSPFGVETKKIWTMNLYLSNPSTSKVYLQPTDMSSLTIPATVSSGLEVHEKIINEFDFTCNGMDLLKFPFDTQKCIMSVQYHDGARVNFLVNPGDPSILSDASSDEWKIANASVKAQVGSNGLCQAFDLHFVFARKSYYYVVFLIVPTILLQSVGILTFVLPTDQGEKVVLGATLILAVYVLLSDLKDMIPQMDEENVPHLVTAIKVGFILSAVSLVEGVLIQTCRIVAFDLPDKVHLSVHNMFCCSKLFCKDRTTVHPDNRLDENSKREQTQVAISELRPKSSLRNDEITILDADIQSESTKSVSEEERLQTKAADFCKTFETIETALQNMVKHLQFEKQQRELIESAWRKIEYTLNLITLLCYVVCSAYYFGYYIYL